MGQPFHPQKLHSLINFPFPTNLVHTKKVSTAFIGTKAANTRLENPENKIRPLKGRIVFRGTTLVDRRLSAPGPLGIKEQGYSMVSYSSSRITGENPSAAYFPPRGFQPEAPERTSSGSFRGSLQPLAPASLWVVPQHTLVFQSLYSIYLTVLIITVTLYYR